MDKEKSKALTTIEIKPEHVEAMEVHRKQIRNTRSLILTANENYNEARDEMADVVRELYPETEGYRFAINWEPMYIVLTRKESSFEEYLRARKEVD